MSEHSAAGGEHAVHVSRKEYWVIFVWLAVLTALEVILAKTQMDKTLMVSGLIVLAIGPLVIHIFSPSRMYESPSFVARSLIDAASDPACGSVSAKAAIFLPAHRSGRYFSRMCLLPPR